LHLAVLAISASGQSLAEPERVAGLSRIFDTAASAPQLRCQITSTRPTLDFGFRFQTGYTIDMPLNQFRGSGHGFSIHTRVTAEGKAPVFLTSSEVLPEVPQTKADAETSGTFVVGEGTYGVEVLVEDDEHRLCHSSWQIQARRTGSERQFAPTTAPGTVAEFDPDTPPAADSKTLLRTGRLTILLHAAPMSSNLSSLQPGDIERLMDSLSSLLRELPARSVRLIAFNLDQQAILFRKDGFGADQMGELATALGQLELARVDVQTLQASARPIDLLAGLVQVEFREKEPPDALIVLGPQTRMQDGAPSQTPDKAKPFPIVYLQHQAARGLLMRQGLSPGPMRQQMPRAGYPQETDVAAASAPLGTVDRIEKLMGLVKGETVVIRTPHDLADAIRRIDARLIKTDTRADVVAKAEVPANPAVAPAPPEAARAARPTDPDPVSTRDEDPTEVLMRVRDQVLEHGQRIPNHTCVETVDRERYARIGDAPKSCDAVLARRRVPNFSSQLRLSTTDRLRLDVAFAGDREIYSWAGANKFDDGDIDELIPEGAMGTGPFATFLLSIFIDRAPRFVFEGETPLAGRTLYEYSFQVPREESHYRHKAGKEWVIIGYSGRLLVEPQTGELVRMTVRTQELPPETQSCEVDTSMDYGKVRLSGADFLLPKSTRQRFIARDGSESENQYAFSECRDFQAESSIVFGGGERSAGRAQKVGFTAMPQWPAGLPVNVDVTTTIDSDRAAAGDRIEGRLALPIRDQNGHTLAPQGAKVVGRLMRVEVRQSSPQVTIALRWETLELEGPALPLSLAPNRAAKPGTQAGGLAGLAALKRRGAEIELPLPGEERCAVFHFAGKRSVVDGGLRTEWFTAKP
jgi:hypothetical protein